jgi:hypothetical protein
LTGRDAPKDRFRLVTIQTTDRKGQPETIRLLSSLTDPLIAARVIGAIAAQGHYDILEIQLTRTLAAGELTPEQVREAVIQLVPYIGYPSSGGLLQASEAAITAVTKEKDPRDGE